MYFYIKESINLRLCREFSNIAICLPQRKKILYILKVEKKN